uniref:NADH:ubiquinone reductase (non-electrogenic) n=1 Tax=Nicotiana sylvestris TaxID=4096 RepID=A0A1U7XS41_NICSY
VDNFGLGQVGLTSVLKVLNFLDNLVSKERMDICASILFNWSMTEYSLACIFLQSSSGPVSMRGGRLEACFLDSARYSGEMEMTDKWVEELGIKVRVLGLPDSEPGQALLGVSAVSVQSILLDSSWDNRCSFITLCVHQVSCQTVTDGVDVLEPWNFNISYDKLVIASGAQAMTFGIKGVMEHAIFLREVHHAQEIRRKLLLNLMLSDVPGVTEEEKRRLLHCVVVGGGPTGVEFSGELSDFIMRDVHQRYAHVKDYIHVTLIEANEILSSFDDRLRVYAIKQLTKSGVRLVRGVVKDVQPEKIILSDGTDVPYGLLVWSTGVGPSPFVNSLDLPKARGRIGIDEWLRVPSVQDVFSIGDCSGFLEGTGKQVLPALAQVAERQGKYLAGLLNRLGKEGGGHANSAKDMNLGDPFMYKHLGSMATVGRYKALVDLRESKAGKGLSLAGFTSWLIWRSAYLTRVVSWRNRFYVAINWLTTFIFGRDISRI